MCKPEIKPDICPRTSAAMCSKDCPQYRRDFHGVELTCLYARDGFECLPWYRKELEAVSELLAELRKALEPGTRSLTMWTDSLGQVMVRRGGAGVAVMGYALEGERDKLADSLTRLVGVFEKSRDGRAIVLGIVDEAETEGEQNDRESCPNCKYE